MGRVSPKVVLDLYKARALSPDELPDLHRVVRELAKRADLPSIPQLYYVPSKMLNAFAVGTPQEFGDRGDRRPPARHEHAPARRHSRP